MAQAQNTNEARDYLSGFLHDVISDIYDNDQEVQECIGILAPNSEYPDYAHKTVAQFLKEKA